jgi:hypothetical protein
MLQTLQRLASILAQLPLPNPLTHSLSIGCGYFSESILLEERFPAALHVGLDIYFTELLQGQAVLQADGRALPFARQRFDLLLIRHPDIDRRPQTWATILPCLGEYLTPQGVALVTLYSASESDFVRDHLALPALCLPEAQLHSVNIVRIM